MSDFVAPTRNHGIDTQPIATSVRSTTRASATVPTIPVTTSAMMPRWKPSVNSTPRLCTPSTALTVTSAVVLTATTRNPASSPGPASGSSTARNRRTGE